MPAETEPAAGSAETRCPHCASVVPDATFCGACGAHLRYAEAGSPAGRLHAYCAFPHESVFRLSLVTSLFPQLGHRSKAPFRAAFAAFVTLLVAGALAGLEPLVIATSAFGVPLLFVLYLFEVDPYEESFVVPSAAVLLIGGVLGTAWALVGGPIGATALVPAPDSSLTSGSALLAAVVLPVTGQLLMAVPVLVLRIRARRIEGDRESLDGFAAGATGALGFTLAATLVFLVSRLSDGQLVHQPFLNSLADAVVRGLSSPVIAAATTGFIGASIWTRLGRTSAAGGRLLGSAPVALGSALLLQVGLGFLDTAGLPDAVVVVVHLAAIAVMLVLLRVGIHHLLLHEHHDFFTRPDWVCPHCQHVVPSMPFCPNCGVATRATPRPDRSAVSPAAA